MPPPVPRRPSAAPFVLALFLLALAVRLLPVPAATAGGIRLLSPDCYAHLRRAALTVRSFPHVPFSDPFVNHPDGGVFIWPPLFDLAIGGASRVLYGPAAPLEKVALVAASIPPFLGALHVVPLFLLARRLLGLTRARVATLAYALLPAAVTWSEFGHADHHVAEALSLLLFLLAASRAAGTPDRPIRRAALAGAALALGVFTWQGFVFAAGLGFLWAFFALAPLAAAALGTTAAALSIAGTALALAGEPPLPFAFVSFGWFQPLLVSAGALLLVLRGAVASRGRGRALAVALAILLAGVTLPSAPRLAGAVLRGGTFLASRGPDAGLDDFDQARKGYLSYPRDFLSVVFEAQPLLPSPIAPSLAAAVADLSPGLLALPWALFLWAKAGLVRSGRARGRLLLALFGTAILLMALSQRRNVYYLAIFTSLAVAEGLARIAPLARRLDQRRYALPLPALTALLAVLLVVLPGRVTLAAVPTYREAPGRDFLALLSRLREVAPPPSDPLAFPLPRPGEWSGVFGPWTAGHFVTALAGRPAAADPNVYGFRRQCRLYTAGDSREAEAILRQARCEWLLTVNLRPVLERYAAAAGRPPGIRAEETFAVRVHESASRAPVPFLELLLDSRTAWRTPAGRILPAFRIWRVRSATETEGASAQGPAGREAVPAA